MIADGDVSRKEGASYSKDHADSFACDKPIIKSHYGCVVARRCMPGGLQRIRKLIWIDKSAR